MKSWAQGWHGQKRQYHQNQTKPSKSSGYSKKMVWKVRLGVQRGLTYNKGFVSVCLGS